MVLSRETSARMMKSFAKPDSSRELFGRPSRSPSTDELAIFTRQFVSSHDNTEMVCRFRLVLMLQKDTSTIGNQPR